jgi:hypothetical protein
MRKLRLKSKSLLGLLRVRLPVVGSPDLPFQASLLRLGLHPGCEGPRPPHPSLRTRSLEKPHKGNQRLVASGTDCQGLPAFDACHSRELGWAREDDKTIDFLSVSAFRLLGFVVRDTGMNIVF